MKLEDLHVGAEVWWTDPAEGLSSGYYKIIVMPDASDIPEDEIEDFEEDCVITIKNEAGSEAEVFLHELS